MGPSSSGKGRGDTREDRVTLQPASQHHHLPRPRSLLPVAKAGSLSHSFLFAFWTTPGCAQCLLLAHSWQCFEDHMWYQALIPRLAVCKASALLAVSASLFHLVEVMLINRCQVNGFRIQTEQHSYSHSGHVESRVLVLHFQFY